jgi:hypothetical protein
MPPQVSILGNSQFEPPGIDECVKGAVDDPLWPDVHPATGSHLAIVGNSHMSWLPTERQAVSVITGCSIA